MWDCGKHTDTSLISIYKSSLTINSTLWVPSVRLFIAVRRLMFRQAVSRMAAKSPLNSRNGSQKSCGAQLSMNGQPLYQRRTEVSRHHGRKSQSVNQLLS